MVSARAPAAATGTIDSTEEHRVPFSFRWSKALGRGLRLNAGRSGVSLTKRLGRATVSTTGRVSVRLGKGLSWRGKLW